MYIVIQRNTARCQLLIKKLILFLSKQRNRKTEIAEAMDTAKNIARDTNKVFKSRKVVTYS